MAWYVIAAEALIVVAITIRLIMKFRAMRGSDDDEGLPQDSTPSGGSRPEVTLPDEEKWE